MMKKGILIVGSIIVLVVISFIILVNKMDKDVDIILSTSINDVDLSAVSDGTYVGEYNDALMVKATIEVTVTNHEIVNITILEHDNGKGEQAEVILTDFVQQQSVMVDDIAGATISSRVLKLALMDALKVKED